MGGEPERDESGLPPVDIQIPDDASELARDVQAYYRELRALRRRRLVERLIAPFARHGMVLPLVAGTLAVTLFAGTMLTVITSAPDQPSVLPPPRTGVPPLNGSSWATSYPPPGELGGPLPDAAIFIGTKRSQLRSLRSSVLAIIPIGCRCAVALRQLTAQAIAAQIKIYFVGTAGGVKQLASLAAHVGQGTKGTVQVVNDVQNVLGASYHPSGLTAVLVHSDSAVTSVHRKLIPGLDLEIQIQQLAGPGLRHQDS